MPDTLAPKSSLNGATKEELIRMYTQIRLIRRVEESLQPIHNGKSRFCHLYIGQESVAVGAAASTMDDYWITAYREHGHAIAKGVSANEVMAELFGKATGSVHGLSGSMHIFDKSKIMGGWGCWGTCSACKWRGLGD